MKKILSFFVVVGLLMSIVGVIGDETENQSVNADIVKVIDISVNNIDYEDVIPGEYSDKDSIVTVGENNNVGLTVSIQVTDAGTGNLFENIIFDLDGLNEFDEPIIGITTLYKDIADDSGANTIPTRLQVPVGFAPGLVSGTVSYTAMEDIITP